MLESRYVISVPDARASARFYVEQLGFEVVHQDGSWTFVSRPGCTIMLGSCPGDPPARELGCHSYFAYLVVDDGAALHAEWKRRGVEVISDVADGPWGMREFAIRTPDGHRPRVGQYLGLTIK